MLLKSEHDCDIVLFESTSKQKMQKSCRTLCKLPAEKKNKFMVFEASVFDTQSNQGTKNVRYQYLICRKTAPLLARASLDSDYVRTEGLKKKKRASLSRSSKKGGRGPLLPTITASYFSKTQRIQGTIHFYRAHSSRFCFVRPRGCTGNWRA